MSRKPFHPFLFAIYPILFLYSKNATEFPPQVLTGPIVVSLMFTTIIGIILWRYSSNPLRSMFLLSLFVLLFYSYGHFYLLIEQTHLTANPKFALIVYGIIFLLLMVLAYKRIRNWNRATSFFNILSVCLITFTLLNTAGIARSSRPDLKMTTVSPKTAQKNAPDIFYIILDGYPRHDILQKVHHFDNSKFLTSLKQKGFRILENSHSNYPGTSLSLASSLNFSYLDEIVPPSEIRSGNRWFLKKLIEKNRVMELLKREGYATAAFDSGYFSTEIKNVDHFYTTGWLLNEFHEALFDTTPLWVVFKNVGRYGIQRRRILYILDHLARIKEPQRPVFVFAHIMALHPPFVFGPNGEERNDRRSSLQFWKDFGEPSREEISRQYQDQLSFINKKVTNSIESILQNRTRPVLILLQGDHGSSFVSPQHERDFYKERFSILNAIRFSNDNRMYDSMSPVNTFRVIFNSLFATGLPLLPDRNFYSQRDEPYQWKEVTSIVVQ